MAGIDKTQIARLLALAEELPENEKKELQRLVMRWDQAPRASRVCYKEKIHIRSAHGDHYGYARDVSLSGLFIEVEPLFAIGEQLFFSLTFISAVNPIQLSGCVVRRCSDGVAVTFDKLPISKRREFEAAVVKHRLILDQA